MRDYGKTIQTMLEDYKDERSSRIKKEIKGK
jgi:hypothetical protein